MREGILGGARRRGRLAVGPDRLGATLQHVNLSAVPIDGPLDVLRPAVMALDAARQLAQPLQFLIAQARTAAQLCSHRDRLDAAVGARQVLHGLVRQRADADLAGDLAEHPAIGRDLTADDRGAQAPGGLDRDHRAVAAGRTACEHHARRARIDHPLHDHCHRHLLLGEAVRAAVADRLGRVEARPAALDAAHALLDAAHPQIGILQSGGARIARILRGGRGADRHRRLRVGAAETCVRCLDLLPQLCRQRRLLHAPAQRLRVRRQRGQIVRIEPLERCAQRRVALEQRERLFEGAGGDDEASRHAHARALELAKTAALAADLRALLQADFAEPADVPRVTHQTGCRMVTIPRPPSTRMRWPSLMRVVAVPVPTTAGRPNSRATMAAWLIEPPMSDTAAEIFWNTGAQVGLVTWQTRMSPCRSRPISSTDRTIRAGPSAMPLEAANPLISLPLSSPAASQVSRLSRVMPQSITI